jgi:predicted secreted protein
MAIAVLLTATTQARVTAQVGETIQVELQDVSSTGYRWTVQHEDHSVVVLERDDLRPGVAPGAAGLRTFVFRTVGAGVSRLRFMLGRPWETDKAPIDERTVEITVN